MVAGKRDVTRRKPNLRYRVRWLTRVPRRDDFEDAPCRADFESWSAMHIFEGWLAVQDWAYGIEVVPL